MQIVAATSRGKVRELNEDAFWYNDTCAVVCDGMGGHQAGEIASQLAADTVAEFAFEWKEPQAEIEQVIQMAHERILRAAEHNNGLFGMGTTITLVAVPGVSHPGKGFLGHVGDSRAYLYRGGQLQQLTVDHSVTQELVRSGQLDPKDVRHHPQRNMLTQALGAGTIRVDTQEVPLVPNDRIILCSDGLTAVVEEPTIVAVLEQHGKIADAADELVRRADESGGPDNTTVLLIQVTDSETASA